jgi:hypothetical protein
MIHGYYAKHEQYKDYRREAEQERIIRQIQKANQENKHQAASSSDWKGSWISRISWAIKEARGITAH